MGHAMGKAKAKSSNLHAALSHPLMTALIIVRAARARAGGARSGSALATVGPRAAGGARLV